MKGDYDMNKRQYKKNIRKQTMTLSRSELARVWLSKNYKRRKQRLKCIFRLYKKWSGPIVYKHYNYSDYVREYNKNHTTDSQPLTKKYGG